MRDFRKPTIALRKVNEVEYVNARTYWSLHHNGAEGYELQVKYDMCDTKFTRVRWDMGDTTQLVTNKEYCEWVEAIVEHEDVSVEEATRRLDAKVMTMMPYEEEIFEHLVRTWNAFALLFSPAINM